MRRVLRVLAGSLAGVTALLGVVTRLQGVLGVVAGEPPRDIDLGSGDSRTSPRRRLLPWRELGRSGAALRWIVGSKKRMVLSGAVVIALAAGIGAIAYWTTGGTGTANATTGTLQAPSNSTATA